MISKKTLFLLGLPIMSTMEDFSSQINLTTRTLYHFSTKSSKFYKTIHTTKANGKIRILHSPSAEMKAIQAWILRNILEKLPTHKSATGFIRKQSILVNAERHRENSFCLCLDITDFFNNTSKKKVFTFFRSLGYPDQIAITLTNLCTHENGLPQGGVSSPALSNLVNTRLDHRISSYVGKRNIVYTRYADDITISSNNSDQLYKAKKVIEKILDDEGYQLNSTKTRFLRPGALRKITGLVISDDNNSIGVGRKEKRILRAKIHQSLNSTTMNKSEKLKKENHIQGWLNYLNSIDKNSVRYLGEYYAKEILKIGKNQAASTSIDDEIN